MLGLQEFFSDKFSLGVQDGERTCVIPFLTKATGVRIPETLSI